MGGDRAHAGRPKGVGNQGGNHSPDYHRESVGGSVPGRREALARPAGVRGGQTAERIRRLSQAAEDRVQGRFGPRAILAGALAQSGVAPGIIDGLAEDRGPPPWLGRLRRPPLPSRTPWRRCSPRPGRCSCSLLVRVTRPFYFLLYSHPFLHSSLSLPSTPFLPHRSICVRERGGRFEPRDRRLGLVTGAVCPACVMSRMHWSKRPRCGAPWHRPRVRQPKWREWPETLHVEAEIGIARGRVQGIILNRIMALPTVPPLPPLPPYCMLALCRRRRDADTFTPLPHSRVALGP